MRVAPRMPSKASYSSSMARECDSISPISRNSGTVMKASLVSVDTRLLANMPNADGPRNSTIPVTLTSRKTTKIGMPRNVSATTEPKIPPSVTYQGRLSKGGLRLRRRGGRDEQAHELAREMEGRAAEAIHDRREQPPLGDEQRIGGAHAAAEGAHSLLVGDEGRDAAHHDRYGDHQQRQPIGRARRKVVGDRDRDVVLLHDQVRH